VQGDAEAEVVECVAGRELGGYAEFLDRLVEPVRGQSRDAES